MRDIIIAYPVKDIALKLRAMLESEGFYVSHICALGSSVLSIAQGLNEGIIICASVLSDMSAGSLAERLPAGFDVVALCRNGSEDYIGNLVNLPLPLHKDDFLQTISLLSSTRSSFSKRSKTDGEAIYNAKVILMKTKSITECQAHKYLQNESMKTGKKIVELAKEIIKNYSD